MCWERLYFEKSLKILLYMLIVGDLDKRMHTFCVFWEITEEWTMASEFLGAKDFMTQAENWTKSSAQTDETGGAHFSSSIQLGWSSQEELCAWLLELWADQASVFSEHHF